MPARHNYNKKIPAFLEQGKPELKDVLKGYDRNSEGRLSWEDVRAALEYLGANQIGSYFRATTALSTADTNKDGYISIDNDELKLLVDYVSRCGYKVPI